VHIDVHVYTVSLDFLNYSSAIPKGFCRNLYFDGNSFGFPTQFLLENSKI